MRDFLDRLRYKIQQFMQGRYGSDELNRFLWFVALAFFVASCFGGLVSWLSYFYAPALVILIFCIFRQMSKNVYARSKELDSYVKIKDKISGFFKLQKRKWSERNTHKFYRCPKCHATVRVPKGRGRIMITCPKCKEEFIKTT